MAWHPWGPEAFARAKAEGKPVLLSVGYSTCHWCHVMAHESFEDARVADYLNQHFVSIKVDREERPDIDAIYMAVCQAMTGQGGWPLTVFLTPDQHPFFAGTYFPKEDRWGRPGFLSVLERIAHLWTHERARVEAGGAQVAEAVRRELTAAPLAELGGPGGAGGAAEAAARDGAATPALLEEAYRQLRGRFDEGHGGFGSAPKFPTPHQLVFLLRYAHRAGSGEAADMAERTLDGIRRGGVYDQVGFGVHRYSTDARWFLPHFEKMLYDQAQLTLACLEAFQATGHARHAGMAREMLEYVLRDLRAPEGGFESAEDADSEGAEGKFYLWTPEELTAALGASEGAWVARLMGVEEGGNFREEATGHAAGGSVLFLRAAWDALAKQEGTDPEALRARWGRARAALLDVRGRRIRPHKDDKVLTDWNGLMIAALARAAWVLDEPAWGRAATEAAAFLWTSLRRADGRLLHRYRKGQAGIPGMLDDYAFFLWGLIELYEATGEPEQLARALELAGELLRRFSGDGALLPCAARDHEVLIANPVEAHDGAVPSGNGVAAWSLLRLGRLTGDREWEARGEALAGALAARMEGAPMVFTQALVAVDFALGPRQEIVVVGAPEDPAARKLWGVLRGRYLPRSVWHRPPPGAGAAALQRLAPWTAGHGLREGRAAAYVCRDYACREPVTEPEALAAQVDSR